MRRLVEETREHRVLSAVDPVPIQAAALDDRAIVPEGIALEEQVKETGGQGIDVVGRLGRTAVWSGRRAVEDGACRLAFHAELGDEVVVRQHEIVARHDHVRRTDVPMHQPVAVKHVQGTAHGPQPSQGQCFVGDFILLFGQQWEHAHVVTQRSAFNPGHERRELVLLPLRGHLKDGRQRGVATQVRARQPVGTHRSLAGVLVMGNLGNVDPAVLLCRTIDLDDLERRANATGAEAGHDPIVAPMEPHLLFFGPEPRRGRRGLRRRLAEQLGELRLQVVQSAARTLVVRQPGPQRFYDLPARLVVPLSKQPGQAGTERVDTRSEVRPRANLASGSPAALPAPNLPAEARLTRC